MSLTPQTSSLILQVLQRVRAKVQAGRYGYQPTADGVLFTPFGPTSAGQLGPQDALFAQALAEVQALSPDPSRPQEPAAHGGAKRKK